MKKEEKIVCDFAYDFISKNWEKIDKEKCDLTSSKIEFLKKLNNDFQLSCWVIFEVSNWAMDRNYLEDLRVEGTEDLEFTILNINGINLKFECDSSFDPWKVSLAEKRTKTVEYWV